MKIIKVIIAIFIVAIVTFGAGVYATYNYLAKDISYTKSDGTKTNVENALNELYGKIDKELVFVKQSDTIMADALTTKTANINLEAGNYIIIGIAKTAEWGTIFGLTGDDSIKSQPKRNFYRWDVGKPSSSIEGYRQGRGAVEQQIFNVKLTEPKVLTGSLKVVTNGTDFMVANQLITVGGFFVYKFE